MIPTGPSVHEELCTFGCPARFVLSPAFKLVGIRWSFSCMQPGQVWHSTSLANGHYT